MKIILGIVLLSFFVTSLLLIPLINLLFELRRKYQNLNSKKNELSPIHNYILKNKDEKTPVGGGLLLIPVIVILFLISFLAFNHKIDMEAFILIFSLLTFGYIGFIDDVRKIFSRFTGKYTGLKGRYILGLQTLFALIISLLLFHFVGLNNIFLPFVGNVVLGWLYIPLAILVIVSFSNAYNISDGMDGLSTGLLLICLLSFLVLAHTVFDSTLSLFVGIWVGVIIAFLYFNVYPARIYLGDAGAFGFGATLAVVGLLTGKILGVAVIGGVYIIIVGSSLLQILSKKFFKRKVFPIAPIHFYFKYLGWEEPKIVMRFWLAGTILAIFGLWLALLSN